ncbi:hypothetical protein FHE72_23445 (plasmid) [Rossellomorea vietnamensis]|uniref:Uncharacterized protein n=1 Tax=Rossellomorea vietnamensis TaxID=218284 RepID=A0A6I6UUY1_9BACI|nr:hypothetical protein [Rossellomorea vietnamensis]QHE63949.1 hypothetical protein FHE72_23445 [Rossellomorea vietnamensis]
MKKYSRFDLMSSAVLDNAGGLIHRLFESRHARLNVKVSTYHLKRAQVFVGTINEIVEDETDMILTVEMLTEMLYKDFLRSIDEGTTLDMLSKWIRSVRVDENGEQDLSIHHYLNESKELNVADIKRQLKSRHKKTENFTYISVKIDKQHILKGEVLLHDLHEAHPDLELDVEEFLSLRFKDIILQVKSGNYEILKNIVNLVLL